MYICGLMFILIESSCLCVKKLKPKDIGATKNTTAESLMEHMLKMCFCCVRMIFFFFLHLKGQLGTTYYFRIV